MTQNFARYIQIARHHIYGTPLDEEARIEHQKVSAIEDFPTYIVRRLDTGVRMELFVPSDWSWDDDAGATVRFSVDGQGFVLAHQNERCHLFLEVNGSKVPLALLPDQDMQQFTDRLLVEIGHALDRTMLT
jgi:hypothetical protein